MTLVGLCIRVEQLVQEPVVVVDAGKSLRPIGGVLQSHSGALFMYYLYPPTTSSMIAVRLRGIDLGTLIFDGGGQSPTCPLRATGDYVVIACQSIMVVEWASSLPFEAGDVALLDVEVQDEGNSSLGFYLESLGNGPKGLVVRFGFRPPNGTHVIVRVNNIYLKSNLHYRLGVPLRSSFLILVNGQPDVPNSGQRELRSLSIPIAMLLRLSMPTSRSYMQALFR